MHLFVGLGNPGPKYANNRHNIGFMALDGIASEYSAAPWRSKFRGDFTECTIDGEKILLLKPQTMMNLSGESVGEAMRFYKLSNADITIFYDELDLDPGKVRIKRGGGTGGHNGIKSIDAHCGAGYRRVRLGIGHPGDKSRVTGHVLGDFAKADQEWLDPLLEAVAKYMPLLVGNEESTFLNRLNAALPKEAKTVSDTDKSPETKGGSRGKSHIHQARKTKPKVEMPKSGPMAEMLKKLLGK